MIDGAKLFFIDSTLRDGSHAIKHQITRDWIERYCQLADKAGFHAIMVGHGNGLGASSLQVGLSLLSEHEMLVAARANLRATKLGVFLLPGFGTIADNLAPAIDDGADVFCIACHCTEADITRQHIEYVKKQGREAFGVLMNYHMTTTEVLVGEAFKMQSYGADGLIVMDSAGASTPELVRKTILTLVEKLSVPVVFHAHNNLGLAVSNSLLALECGARGVDGTIRGFGAGAGNCPLDQLAALLQKIGVKTTLNLYPILDAGDKVVTEMAGGRYGVDSVSVVSGLAGVFSGFAPHVKAAAQRFGVDPRDIFMELGRRKVVAGQEDVIVDVGMNLAQLNKKDDSSYMLESLL